ncbi:hypothetical protein GGF37_002409, partial [Kickxella alabastrina]
ENGGNAITYPRLKRLSLQVLGAYTGSEARQRSAPLGVPFPSLEHLNCGDIYPFANDVLLRGSRATLRKLVLAVDTSVAGWILAKEFDGMCSSTYLSHFKRLHLMKFYIITKASTVTRSTQDVHNRLLHAAFKAPQLAQVRIQYPNFSIAKYTPAHMS